MKFQNVFYSDQDSISITIPLELLRSHLYTAYTSELIPPTIDQMIQRHGEILSMNMPNFVAEENDLIVGYAYCTYFQLYHRSILRKISVAKVMVINY